MHPKSVTFPITARDILFVIGGSLAGVALSSAEIVDLGLQSRSAVSCAVADYPSPVKDATVARSNGAPVVCGGSTAEAQRCYKFDKGSNGWIRTPDMLESRANGHAVVQINEQDFLITGKLYASYICLKVLRQFTYLT